MTDYHDLKLNPFDLPEPGERVIICVGDVFSGEGYLKTDGKWYRYCDFEPVDKYMSKGVTGWWDMPKPIQKKPRNNSSKK